MNNEKQMTQKERLAKAEKLREMIRVAILGTDGEYRQLLKHIDDQAKEHVFDAQEKIRCGVLYFSP